MNDLILCASCARHVRRTELQCPFCGSPVSGAARAATPRIAPPGLSRAKLYAFHAALATGVAASGCGGATVVNADAASPTDARPTDGQGVADAGVDQASGEGGPDATTEGSTTAEAGSDAVADTKPDWGPPPPPYGCVFPEGCGDVKV